MLENNVCAGFGSHRHDLENKRGPLARTFDSKVLSDPHKLFL